MNLLQLNEDWSSFNGSKEFVENHTDNDEKLNDFLRFRTKLLLEEAEETANAVHNRDREEVVDGLVDVVVVALGTLKAFNIDIDKAFDEVYRANFEKTKGVKPGRPNPYGLPDMVKGIDWNPPNHEDNYGNLPKDS